MIRNYLLVTLRNLFKNRVSAFVNIAGLALGMTACILIIQYVRYELSYDGFHEKADRIFRIQQDRYDKGELSTQWAAGCSAVGQALLENFPEVADFTRFQIWNGVLNYGENKFREERIYVADTSFFEVFSFRILEGDRKTALVLHPAGGVLHFRRPRRDQLRAACLLSQHTGIPHRDQHSGRT